MAKYDTHTLSVEVKDGDARYILQTSILFENGDNIQATITEASNILKNEAIRLKQIEFLKDIN